MMERATTKRRKNSMKNFIRMIALTLVLALGLAIFSTALAASASYKGTETTSYTITTGKKDATLKISHSAGKVSATAWKNAIKGTTKTVSKSWYGKFKVTVSCGGSSRSAIVNYPYNKTATFKLNKNSTYKVKVECLGFSDQVGTVWNLKWKTNPRAKLSVNNWAKIK